MEIENLVITLAFKELGSDKLTVVNKPYKEKTVHLELVPMLVARELDQLVYDYRVEYPENVKIKITFEVEDFIDADLEPLDKYNFNEE